MQQFRDPFQVKGEPLSMTVINGTLRGVLLTSSGRLELMQIDHFVSTNTRTGTLITEADFLERDK